MSNEQGMVDYLLSEGAGGEQFGDEVEGSTIDIDPRTVEDHHGLMVKVLEKMNL